MPVARKQLALAAAIMGSFVAGLDSTVVNVALPAIREDLGGGLAGQQWVSNAYLLTLGSLILVAGSLGDLYGERRVFSIGVGGFGVVSMLCALAPTIEVLIAGRALQGVFGALLTPSALAVIIATFPPDERGAAIGSWTAWSGISFVIGPLVGGWLVDTASWRWIFAINVPFVLITLALVAIAVPRTDRRRDVRLDWLGALLTVFGLAGPVLALIRQPVAGWGSMEVWLPGSAGSRCWRCSSGTSGARRSRCCRWSCSSAATSRSATSRRSRCTAGSARCSSSSRCSCSRSRATTRWRPGWRRSRRRS